VSKGLRGHLGALRRGRLTTGALKAAGIPLLALAGAAASPAPRGGAMVLADAALTAGCANLANLLDLRPGRALKVILPAAALLAAGANVLAAAAGTAAARCTAPPARLGMLAVVVALNLASETVSFSTVIERTPVLRALDRLGRRPLPAPGPGPTHGGTR